MKKKIFITLILMLILMCRVVNVYAARENQANMNIIETAKNWITLGESGGDLSTSDWSSFNRLASMLWGIGVFVVVIGGTIIGIKYMFSSVEEKASLKQNVIPYVIGAVIILGALSIWKFSVDLFKNI